MVEGQVDDSSDHDASYATCIGRMEMNEKGCLTLHFYDQFSWEREKVLRGNSVDFNKMCHKKHFYPNFD